MAWSTREVAVLAGTTVSTVRHYHRHGLVAEPRRGSNGYKHYGARELVELLRVRRLAALGVPLAQIGAVRAGGPSTAHVLREVDARLAAGIERRQQARTDLAVALQQHGAVDAPTGFADLAARLSEQDLSILHVCARLYDDTAMTDLRSMVQVDDETAAEIGRAFETLAPDADRAARERLAERLAPALVRQVASHGWLADPGRRRSRDSRAARHTFMAALSAFCSPSQLDVLVRAVLSAQVLLAEREWSAAG